MDHDNGDFAVFESGAILIYLAEKYGKFFGSDAKSRSQVTFQSAPFRVWPSAVKVTQWLMFQMGGIGPMQVRLVANCDISYSAPQGQANVFFRYAPVKIPYAIERYQKETRRLYEVLERQLQDKDFLVGEYSIADIANYSWVRSHEWAGISVDGLPNVQRWLAAISSRPAVKKGLDIPETQEDLKKEMEARLDAVKAMLPNAPTADTKWLSWRHSSRSLLWKYNRFTCNLVQPQSELSVALWWPSPLWAATSMSSFVVAAWFHVQPWNISPCIEQNDLFQLHASPLLPNRSILCVHPLNESKLALCLSNHSIERHQLWVIPYTNCDEVRKANFSPASRSFWVFLFSVFRVPFFHLQFFSNRKHHLQSIAFFATHSASSPLEFLSLISAYCLHRGYGRPTSRRFHRQSAGASLSSSKCKLLRHRRWDFLRLRTLEILTVIFQVTKPCERNVEESSISCNARQIFSWPKTCGRSARLSWTRSNSKGKRSLYVAWNSSRKVARALLANWPRRKLDFESVCCKEISRRKCPLVSYGILEAHCCVAYLSKRHGQDRVASLGTVLWLLLAAGRLEDFLAIEVLLTWLRSSFSAPRNPSPCFLWEHPSERGPSGLSRLEAVPATARGKASHNSAQLARFCQVWPWETRWAFVSGWPDVDRATCQKWRSRTSTKGGAAGARSQKRCEAASPRRQKRVEETSWHRFLEILDSQEQGTTSRGARSSKTGATTRSTKRGAPFRTKRRATTRSTKRGSATSPEHRHPCACSRRQLGEGKSPSLRGRSRRNRGFQHLKPFLYTTKRINLLHSQHEVYFSCVFDEET